MAKWAVTCTCGHDVTTEADSREAAAASLKGMMTEEAIAAHMKEFHQPGEPTPTKDQVDAMIDQGTHEVAAAAA
jgi:hypothetical protein